MNQVSDAALAIAVERAGAYPSLSLPSYMSGGRLDVATYRRDLQAYKDATGSPHLLLSVGSPKALTDTVLRPFFDLGFSRLELFHTAVTSEDGPELRARLDRLRSEHGARIVVKVSAGHLRERLPYEHIILKGPEGAGRSADNSPPLDQALAQCRQWLPNTTVVASGGIGTSAQVRQCLDAGAAAVAIGSLFAASRESRVTDEVKAKIIASESSQLQAIGPNRLRGLFASIASGDDSNLTHTLARGIRDPSAGAVYMGSAIDHITEVLPVADIVRRLMGLP